MKKFKEIKVALMEKGKNFKITKKGKGNYVIRSSNRIYPSSFMESRKIDMNDDDYTEFIENITRQMYDELVEKSKDLKIDTVGLWYTVNDKLKIENCIDIDTLNAMNNFNEEIDPIKEFVKMTLQHEEVS